MTVTVDLPDAAIEVLDAETSDVAVDHPSLAALMKLYVLGRLSSGAVAESAGNGRVEFLDRLAEFGVNSFEQKPEGLAPILAPPQARRS